ncbi:MAG TPA: alkaline phosphatase D family protein [Vicinamibacteria bacterium]|nr:alkaline phosphatase D family protein [Vicinamibacteria bacterium]
MRSRRRFVGAALRAGAGLSLVPAWTLRADERPSVAWGVAAGDVTETRATIWSRTDRPARIVVEYATSSSFAAARRVTGPAALEAAGFTTRVELQDLPTGRTIHYRVRFQRASGSAWSEPVVGRFRTGPARGQDVVFGWGADTVGQGFGINPDWGGLRIYDALRRAGLDFFIHCGDTVYADGPLVAELPLDDGGVWRNLVTPAKSKVAETLDEFRGNYLYNLTDEKLRSFNAEVPQIVLWDDHEVRNNWYPSQRLGGDPRYQILDVDLLAARGKQAFLEHQPIRLDEEDARRIDRAITYGPSLEVFVLDMRSERGPNSPNRQAAAGPETALLGPRQIERLKRRLRSSRATWKVIATGSPIGLLVRDGESFEGVANGEGPPLGRELEIADLLRFLREQRIRNVVWLTGDVHYAAAHHYAPERARFREFDPFWEFVAGPLHAGTFGPSVLDETFGPEVRFLGIPRDLKPNRPPSAGLQFFGTARIDGRSEVMNVRLHDLEGRALFGVDLPPERG